MSDLPTPRDMVKTGFRLNVWCMSCRHSQDTDFSALIAAGKGDQPIAKMRFRCTNCRSLRTNFAVTGSHIQPSKR
jgi:ribosomal protein S27E